jgi:hypothetical protein
MISGGIDQQGIGCRKTGSKEKSDFRSVFRDKYFVFCIILFIITLVSGTSYARSSRALPEPSGKYGIGTRYFYLTDNNRLDMYTSGEDDYRRISIQAWYPAQPGDGENPVNYSHPEGVQIFVEMGFWQPSFITDIVNRSTHSYLNARIDGSKEKYPVILFSASGVMDANIILCEELASHGFVVLSIGHPHWCEYYYDARGEIILLDKSNPYYVKMWEEEQSDEVVQLKEKITLSKKLKEKLRLFRELNRNMQLESSDIRLWSGDISFIIDQMDPESEIGSSFDGRLDPEKIGVMGYSKGGAAAAQACISESRCKAGINLSGFMFGDIVEYSLDVPFMNMENMESWCVDCPAINDFLYYTSNSDIYMLQIAKAAHGNFTDISAFKDYLSPKFAHVLGTIDGRRFLDIQNKYVRQFFDRYLQDRNAPLLGKKSPAYPEVQLKFKYADN